MRQKPERTKSVAFIDADLRTAFEELKKGKYEEQCLAMFLNNAIDALKENPLCGIKIPSKLWPKEYVRKYRIDNLRKYDLPNAWRIIYTLRGNEIEIISVIIEWLSHKDYERRFKY